MNSITIRSVDVILAAIAMILLIPLFAILSLVLLFTGEGEVLYRQSRVGLGGVEFQLFKFATMMKDSASLGAGDLTLPADPRILPFGQFLRRWKLNELPQLWNILVGDLSFIGPRPQTRRYQECYGVQGRAVIETVRPGLSGVGSIIFRDEEVILSKTEDPVSFDLEVITPYKLELELWFVRNFSFKLYCELIVLTVFAVLFPRSRVHSVLLKRLPDVPESLRRFLF